MTGSEAKDRLIEMVRDEAPEALEAMRAEFAKYPKVEHVQLDSAWVKKLDALLRLTRLAVTFLAAVLGVALIAVTFNTIRLQILTQGAEIEVSRLLGATVRGPTCARGGVPDRFAARPRAAWDRSSRRIALP